MMTLEEARARLLQAQRMELPSLQQSLYRDVLEALALGHPDPQGLAKAALGLPEG